MCRDCAPSTRLYALEPQQPSCPAQREPCPLPALQEALKAAPPTCLGRGFAPEPELAPLPPKRENFLCSCTQLGLILLVGATSGRRTVVGDQLRSVDNTFTSLSIFIPSSRPSWAFILFCNLFFFFSPRPLKTILAVSLSHPRVLEWYEIPRKVFKSQTLISLVLFLAMKISSQGYSPDSCWSVLLRILALLGGLFPSSLVRLSSAGLC